MKSILSTLLCLLIGSSAVTLKAQQGRCGTDERLAEILKTNPELLKTLTDYYGEIAKGNTSDQRLSKKGTTRTIPVVFHVMHAYGPENISKAQIEDQMRIMNEAFQRLNADTANTRSIFKSVAADMDIEFKLARIDPSGNCTEGITRTFTGLTDGGDDAVKSLVRWDYRKYLNIWVVKNIQGDGSSAGRTLGYAYLPANTNSAVDGIVMLADYVGSIGTASGSGNKGRVLVHEAGHWLGLLHPFQSWGGQDGCGGNCSNSGDYICDTPPVAEPSFGCPTTNNTCNNDSPDQLDMVENFMDYANGSCQNMFTKGQKAVVDNSLNKSNYRQNNITTQNHTATGIFTTPSCSAIADFNTTNNTVTVCQGGKVSFKDYTYNGTVSTYAWSFTGGSPSTSAKATPDSVAYNTAGQFKVSLTVSNAQGTNTKTIDKMINVIPTVSSNKTPMVEGFESATVLANSWSVLETSDYGWKRTTSAKYAGAAGVYAYIDDGSALNTIYNLVSAPYDMTPLKGLQPKLKFKAAYRPAITGSTELLFIWASKDCGQTWIAIKAFSNNNGLGVDKVADPGWAPTSQADWKDMALDLTNYENVKNLMIKFEARSKSGNSIYLDNINIEGELTGALKPMSPNSFAISIHPNPSKGLVNIDVNTDGKSFKGIKIFNSTGQEVENHLILLDRNGDQLNYSVQPMAAGVYFAQINIEGQIIVKKFIVTP